jgi:hypothetical protein
MPEMIPEVMLYRMLQMMPERMPGVLTARLRAFARH